MAPYIASLLGFFIFSGIADNLGRKPAIGISWFIGSIGTIILAFSVTWWMAALGYFFAGFGANPAITISISMMSEISLGNFR